MPASNAAAAIPTVSGTALFGCFHAHRVISTTPRVKITHVNFTVMYKVYTVQVLRVVAANSARFDGVQCSVVVPDATTIPRRE
jgi:hypothetical protein